MSDPAEETERTITVRVRRTHLWAVSGLVVGLALGVVVGRATHDTRPVLYGLPPAAGDTTTASAAPVEVDTAGRPARGPADAKVTVVEFVDFECPFCGRFARDTLPRLDREFGSRIRYVSRHFPLPSHPHAQHAAVAAECAHEQGRYWEFHRRLFADQSKLDPRSLRRHAEELGLDTTRFAACRRSDSTQRRVDRDAADGRDYGVTGTPTFFVDGRILRGAQPYEQIKAELERALSSSG